MRVGTVRLQGGRFAVWLVGFVGAFVGFVGAFVGFMGAFVEF